MRKLAVIFIACIVALGAYGAVRDAAAVNRDQSSVTTAARTTNTSARATTTRSASTPTGVASRGAVSRTGTGVNQPVRTTARTATTVRRNTPLQSSASQTSRGRAATATPTIQTRTGMEYETCKSAYFDCMDQFCALKNDNYRRCSCSDDIYGLIETDTVLYEANTKLTEFTESLDAVGLTAAQAGAMRKASEGENALTADTSASKALLNAILNSITGKDTNVSGKFAGLNPINLSFDPIHSFGTSDVGQTIAAYNGSELYGAIYNQCRLAVANDCNTASLQRAVTAYLMAIEQDCNTVRTSINDTQKKLTAAVREGSAMLDLARIENRREHNTSDMATCIANVEAAILSEEVCGANYHKCLDNGEFIDIATGAPIIGVVKFYELENMLSYNHDKDVPEQNLSKIQANQVFVKNFEYRTKRFAAPALDKCVEDADTVWADYLDKAMIDIFYAQKSKVAEIKQGCFDFISSCYVNSDNAVTAAMSSLTSAAAIGVQPDRISLNSAVCTEYVASCDNMFDGNIVQQYVLARQSTDNTDACRAVVKQCFDKYGGTTYENFFNPHSGLFERSMSQNNYRGNAHDWFTLYNASGEYVSECAKQLANLEPCSGTVEQVFGGFDKSTEGFYGLMYNDEFSRNILRANGVATEVYNQIMDILAVQCYNLDGLFIKAHRIKPSDSNSGDWETTGGYSASNFCELVKDDDEDGYLPGINENMCPRDYGEQVDIQIWGACLCWERGARRSRWGRTTSCRTELPITQTLDGDKCSTLGSYGFVNNPDTIGFTGATNPKEDPGSELKWCDAGYNVEEYRVCRWGTDTNKPNCSTGTGGGAGRSSNDSGGGFQGILVTDPTFDRCRINPRICSGIRF